MQSGVVMLLIIMSFTVPSSFWPAFYTGMYTLLPWVIKITIKMSYK